MEGFKKITVSLPSDFVASLDLVSKRLGVSRSAFLAMVAAEPVNELAGLLRELPLEPEPRDVVRFRGRSVELAQARLEAAQRGLDDLFSV